MLKSVLLSFLHCCLWAAYSLVILLSRHDHALFEAVLLVMFAYFAFLLTVHVTRDNKVSKRYTISSTIIYVILKWTLLSGFFSSAFIFWGNNT